MIRILGRRVLLTRDAAGDRVGSIIIPERSRQDAQVGTVVAIGEAVTTLTVGDRVLFGRYAGTAVVLDGTPHVLLWEEDVMGVLP